MKIPLVRTLVASAILAINLFVTSTSFAAAPPPGKIPVGLQLYSLRDSFSKDVPGTLDKVKGMGFKYVELAGTYGQPPEKFKAMLEERGLKAISGHFPFERYRDDAAGVAKEAKALGLEYAGCAWIPHGNPFDEKTCREAIAVFNKAGEVLAKQGIKFFYHIHGYEFAPREGGTLFELLMNETKPEYVSFELDVFWAVHPGQNPVKLLEKYGKRWALTHLKDMRKGTPTGIFTGGTDVKNDVALGTGQIDYPPILKAATQSGVQWHFIEDESPDSETQIPQSLRYLDSIK